MMKSVSFFLIFFWMTGVSAEPIRIFNWWDYLDKRILTKLEKLGEKIHIVEYRSNEVALSKLASKEHGFDIIIVSNIILPVLAKSNLIDQIILRNLRINRMNEYNKKIISENRCVPFLWSSTVYSYDSRFVKKAPDSLSNLVVLKRHKIRIGIIDDQFEVATRLLLDDIKQCKSINPLKDCIKTLSTKKFLEKEDLTSSIGDMIKGGNFAAYGWHGASAAYISEAPWLAFSVASHRPVVGIDYVCVASNSKKKKARLLRIVDSLTDRESISWNMEKTQYFSPYLNHIEHLHPKVLNLYKAVLKAIQNSGSVEIQPPGHEELKILNSWWQALRYE